MKPIKKGDTVSRKAYNKDIIFEVKRIINLSNGKKLAILKGITERIEVDSDVEDLILVSREEVENTLKRIEKNFETKFLKNKREKQSRKIPDFKTGRILHLDGDRKYSEKSLRYYRKMGLDAIVKNISEYRQPKLVYDLLSYYKPDILIITGHDGMLKKGKNYNDIYNYRNSRYFIETVKEARRYEREQGADMVIFAGACQSYYEALIMAGANFASSPARILIDFLDPIVIAEKVATTDPFKYITINDLEKDLRDGKRGVGGIGANRKAKKQQCNIYVTKL